MKAFYYIGARLSARDSWKLLSGPYASKAEADAQERAVRREAGKRMAMLSHARFACLELAEDHGQGILERLGQLMMKLGGEGFGKGNVSL